MLALMSFLNTSDSLLMKSNHMSGLTDPFNVVFYEWEVEVLLVVSILECFLSCCRVDFFQGNKLQDQLYLMLKLTI